MLNFRVGMIKIIFKKNFNIEEKHVKYKIRINNSFRLERIKHFIIVDFILIFLFHYVEGENFFDPISVL